MGRTLDRNWPDDDTNKVELGRVYRERASAIGWSERGRLEAENALREWPFIDWESVAKSAYCFAISQGLEAPPTQPNPRASIGRDE